MHYYERERMCVRPGVVLSMLKKVAMEEELEKQRHYGVFQAGGLVGVRPGRKPDGKSNGIRMLLLRH